MHIREVEPSTYVRVLNEFKNKEINNIVIDTSTANISIILKGVSNVPLDQLQIHLALF